MPVKKTKPLSHKQLVGKMLKNPAVKAEFDKLNREEFAILDEILAARKRLVSLKLKSPNAWALKRLRLLD